jgi:hypothetical protein
MTSGAAPAAPDHGRSAPAGPGADPPRWSRRRLRDHPPEVLVEGFTMTLYVSLSLLAVVVAMPTSDMHESTGEYAQLILLTVLGLVMAHLVAFRLSARMVHGGQLPEAAPEIIAAQLVGGAVVAVLAVVPVLLLGLEPGAIAAELLLVGVVAAAGYSVASRAGLTRTRRLVYVGGVVVLVLVILAVKAAAGH